MAEIGCGEMMSLRRPLLITQEHRLLLEAGADAISTNTLGAVASVMRDYGDSAFVTEVNFESARLARLACDEFTTRKWPRWVLGSMGPRLYPKSVLGGDEDIFEKMRNDYLVQARSLWRGGVDVLHVERCQDLRSARAALLAIRAVEVECGHRMPTMITASFEETGKMLDGSSPQLFRDFICEFDPLVSGVSGRLTPVTEAVVRC